VGETMYSCRESGIRSTQARSTMANGVSTMADQPNHVKRDLKTG
jgi:hypothetical protein